MAFSKELQNKLDYYEQVYFSLDKPIPLKGDLELRPVKVNQYYEFYSYLPCITMDKTVMEVEDEKGRIIKVADIDGIENSYLVYLKRKSSENRVILSQLIGLFELVTGVKQGVYCPICGKEKSYEEIADGMEEYAMKILNDTKEEYEKIMEARKTEINTKMQLLLDKNPSWETEIIAAREEALKDIDKPFTKEMEETVLQKAKFEFITKHSKCECGEMMIDVYGFEENETTHQLWFVIKGERINESEFNDIKAIIPRQNILDYEGDKYIDPELKEELEIKAKLQNSDYTSPTLEKQICAVAVGTGYPIEVIYEMSMRKLSYLLRMIDKKEMYYAMTQASYSGMVQFPEGAIKHWIFSDDKKNIKDELTDAEVFTKKFEQVT